MNLFKNISPRLIALYTALIMTVFYIIILMVYYIFELNFDFRLVLIVTAVFAFLFTYSMVTFMLEHYIFRKVKLIYKIIHSSKTSVQNEYEVRSDDNILNRVSQEVAKWAESQEAEIQSLKQLEEYRRNFIGNISHELKTPVFTIQGYIHTLLDGGIDDDTIKIKYLKRAAQNVDRLSTIIDDLEVISNLERDKLILDLQPFDIKRVVEEVFEDNAFRAKEKDIELGLKDGANQSWEVIADEELIRQVLDNLITNSIKYGHVGGRTLIGFYDMDTYLLIEIADNGIGIEKEHLVHLFDRFYRVDKSRSRNVGGSGLGLSIVKHIMEAHNQTINVRSTKGQGSTFGFTLEKSNS